MSKHVASRRSILAGAAGIAAAGALSAIPVKAEFQPSADFYEIRRLAGAAQRVWESDLSDEEKEAKIDPIERQLDEIEDRLCDRSPTSTLEDLLCYAALALYWSDDGPAGFADPVGTLERRAGNGDCFESRVLRVAAAVFEFAGVRAEEQPVSA